MPESEKKEPPPWKTTSRDSGPYWDDPYTFNALKESVQSYHRFRPASPYYPDVVAAWVLATWRIHEWRAFCPIFLLGPLGSGKTTLLEWLEETCYQAVRGGSMSTSVMFHLSDQYCPTILIDESQIYNAEERAEAQALINESYRPGGKVWRMVGEGRNMRPRSFNAFGPRAFAATKPPWEALTNRSILIHTEYSEEELKQTLTPEFFDEGDLLRYELGRYRERWDVPFKVSLEARHYQGGEQHSEYLDHSEMIRLVLREAVKNPRVREAGFPLLMVAPEGEPRENILVYLKDLEVDHKAQEATGYLSEYVRALTLIAPENGRISARTVREWFANDWNVKLTEAPKERTIMAAFRTLGFQATRLAHGPTGIIWDGGLIERLKARYLGTSSLSSLSSPHEGKNASQGEEGEDSEAPQVGRLDEYRSVQDG